MNTLNRGRSLGQRLVETVLAVALLPLTIPAVITVMGTRGGGR
jgi:hypothetical protein